MGSRILLSGIISIGFFLSACDDNNHKNSSAPKEFNGLSSDSDPALGKALILHAWCMEERDTLERTKFYRDGSSSTSTYDRNAASDAQPVVDNISRWALRGKTMWVNDLENGLMMKYAIQLSLDNKGGKIHGSVKSQKVAGLGTIDASKFTIYQCDNSPDKNNVPGGTAGPGSSSDLELADDLTAHAWCRVVDQSEERSEFFADGAIETIVYGLNSQNERTRELERKTEETWELNGNTLEGHYTDDDGNPAKMSVKVKITQRGDKEYLTLSAEEETSELYSCE